MIVKKIIYWFINTFILIGFLFLILNILYFFHGSFEYLPTEEQQEKVKIATSFMIVITLLLEMLLFAMSWVLKKRWKI